MIKRRPCSRRQVGYFDTTVIFGPRLSEDEHVTPTWNNHTRCRGASPQSSLTNLTTVFRCRTLRIDRIPTFAVGVAERAPGWGSVHRVLCRCLSLVVLCWHVGHSVYVFERVCMFVSGGSSSLLYPDGWGPKTEQATQSPVCSHKPKDLLNTLFIGNVSGPAPFIFLRFGAFCCVISKNTTI